MKTQRLTITLTVLNLSVLGIVLMFFLSSFKPDAVPIVRAQAFELIDNNGKVRAEIKVLPAEPGLKMPDSTVGYPKSVLFRLIDSGGRPNVKISATGDGSGLVLGGEAGYVQILSRTTEPSVKLFNKKGNEQLIKIK